MSFASGADSLRVDAFSVVANSQCEPAFVIGELNLDLRCLGVGEGIDEPFPWDAVYLTEYDRTEGLRRAHYCEGKDGCVILRQLLATMRQGLRQVTA